MRRIDEIANLADEGEKSLEKYLLNKAKAWRALCLKYHNGAQSGFPDRLLLLPNGSALWVEVKSKGKKPSKLQTLRHQQLQRLGQYVAVVDCKRQIDELLNNYQAWQAQKP